jgi:cytochrome oxidase assembly protein ShyY1
MSRTALNTRTILAGLLLVAVAIGCVALGFWQLDRAAERRGIAKSIEKGRAAIAVSLNSRVLEPQSLTNWTPAKAEGTWRDDLSVLLDNRNLEGRPGLWLATPLVLAEGRAVLVLRGWFARPLGAQTAPLITTSSERQTIQGELAQHVPRLFELWSSSKANGLIFAPSPNDPRRARAPTEPSSAAPSAGVRAATSPTDTPGETIPRDIRAATTPTVDTGTLPRLQNLSLAQLSEQSGLNLLPVVLMQTSASNDGLIRVWPEPSVDADKNLGYATQWFGFAAICLFALLVFAWRLKSQP